MQKHPLVQWIVQMELTGTTGMVLTPMANVLSLQNLSAQFHPPSLFPQTSVPQDAQVSNLFSLPQKKSLAFDFHKNSPRD